MSSDSLPSLDVSPSEMDPSHAGGARPLDRRQVGRMVLAAAGGLLAGAALSGCGGDEVAEESATDAALLLKEPHVCRGLNTCKGQGAGGDNACAGQGTCASAEGHDCAGANACAGQGGCGTTSGRNTCKGRGECGVPLGHGSWGPTREAFEAEMTSAGKTFGAAPPEAG